MKKKKTKSPNWGLLDKKRFEWMGKQEINQLRKFSIQKSIKVMENLLDSGFIEECKRIQKELGANKWQKK